MQMGTGLVDKAGVCFNMKLSEHSHGFGIHLVCDVGLQNEPIPVSDVLSRNPDLPCVLEFRTWSLQVFS